ncbi:MAG: ATPase [Bryobacteraceae bacterium]|nr:ATPase [Bryobacteraceae bacterium]
MRLFLGIDGGQSGTTAVIGDESGDVLGCGRGGPCNHVAASEGLAKFRKAILGCVEKAARDAKLDSSGLQFTGICAGFSGGPADKELLLRELVSAEQYFVTTDALIALSGSTGGEPGIITIAGTGSIAFGRNAEGKVARVGGWGYVFGDEGGGFDITRQALRAVLRHEEGWGPPTLLRELLFSAAQCDDANDLMHRFYTPEYPRPVIASYSRLVDDAAREGDTVARNILHNAAQQLATGASAVRGQLFQKGGSAKVAPVGGVFASEVLSDRFRLLVELEDGNTVVAAKYGPATGALLEAYALSGLHHLHLTNVPREKY